MPNGSDPTKVSTKIKMVFTIPEDIVEIIVENVILNPLSK
jgi:hypothetical protein